MTQDARAISWDSIPTRIGQSVNPAISAASVMVYTVPAKMKAKLVALDCTYVRDATGGNVYFVIAITDGTPAGRSAAICVNPMTANVTWIVSMGIGVAQATILDRIVGALPDLPLAEGWIVTAYFVNDTAGDDAGPVRYTVKECPA